MYGMYDTVSATVRYSTTYGTVHRKWSEMYDNTVFSPLQEWRKMTFFFTNYLLKANTNHKKYILEKELEMFRGDFLIQQN